MKYIFLSLITVVSFNFSSQVQSTRIIDKTNCRDGEKVEYCKTHKVMHGLKTDPEFLKSYVADQKELKRIEKTIPSSLKSKVIYNIPLVFHVLHNNGSENISDEQIFDAVSILNRDYRLQNSDANNVQSIFSGMPADIEIEFALATKAPNGQCFSGITRTISALTNDGSSGNSQVSAIISGNDVYNNSWPGNKYLNIFVVGDADGAAGYTYNPSNFIGSSMSNGIWVLHDYVGSIGTSNTNSSRTLTHEVGHWLNLEHTWGPNNNPGNSSSCSDDDFVNDTPRCIGVTSCNLTSNSCSNDVVDGYWTTNVADNVENYMDYSYCSKMFTSGQKNRMRSALLSSVGGRNNIWSSSNLSVTGLNTTPSVCAVEIDVERDLVCSGDNVQFFDESYNNISSWNWTFPGATPSSSTQENPTVSYNGSGSYNVVLQVTDQLGNTLSKTFPNFITVMGNAGSGAPYLEGFESVSSLPSSDWTIINSGGPGFQVVSNVASSGSKSVKLDNSSGTTGDVDELISNPINLSNLTSASLSFKYAFAKRYNSNSDFLRILASNNCGETWVLRKNISSSIIATRSNTGSSYTPTAADWVTINVSGITSAYLVDDFRFKFEFNCGGGNDLFIDDINITGTVSINENEVIEDFIIYPNPANDKIAISFFSNTALNNASIMMFDASGRLVKNIISKDFQIGNQNIEFSIADIENGWYFIQLDSPEGKTSSKLIKY
jgi:PKD repeat protein